MHSFLYCQSNSIHSEKINTFFLQKYKEESKRELTGKQCKFTSFYTEN
jgi:hypothetical protein